MWRWKHRAGAGACFAWHMNRRTNTFPSMVRSASIVVTCHDKRPSCGDVKLCSAYSGSTHSFVHSICNCCTFLARMDIACLRTRCHARHLACTFHKSAQQQNSREHARHRRLLAMDITLSSATDRLLTPMPLLSLSLVLAVVAASV